ncbi:hypothetical protein BJ912DRAFT_563592 [Pholiota molesta]|nr:hypothetical protein BJ912DRAFT_563592 [Pholiota molesta]
MPTSEEAPPPYAKDPQQDPNASHPRSPPRAYGWQNRQPAANPAPNVTQPGATAMIFPIDGHYPYFDRNCHHVWSTQFGLLGILCAIFFCPLGLLCLLCDRQEVCIRCGARRFPAF